MAASFFDQATASGAILGSRRELLDDGRDFVSEEYLRPELQRKELPDLHRPIALALTMLPNHFTDCFRVEVAIASNLLFG